MDVPMQTKIACHVFVWFWKFVASFTGLLFTICFFILAMFHWFCYSLQLIYNMAVIRRYQLEARPLAPLELINYADLQPVLNFQQFLPINMNADAA